MFSNNESQLQLAIEKSDKFYYDPIKLSLELDYANYPGTLKINRILKSKPFHIPGTEVKKEKVTVVVSDFSLSKEPNKYFLEAVESLVKTLINIKFDVRIWNGHETSKLTEQDIAKQLSHVKATSDTEINKTLAQQQIPPEAILHLDYFSLRKILNEFKLYSAKFSTQNDVLDIADLNIYEEIPQEIDLWLENKKMSLALKCAVESKSQPRNHLYEKVDQKVIDRLITFVNKFSNKIIGLILIDVSDISLLELIHKTPHLEELEWKELRDKYDAGDRLCNFKLIKKEDWEKYTDENNITINLPKLKRLAVDSYSNMPGFIVTQILEQGDYLQEIDLSGCIGLDVTKTPCKKNNCLEKINISHCALSINIFVFLMKNAHSLQSLIISNLAFCSDIPLDFNNLSYPKLVEIELRSVQHLPRFMQDIMLSANNLSRLALYHCVDLDGFNTTEIETKNAFKQLRKFQVIELTQNKSLSFFNTITKILLVSEQLQELVLINIPQAVELLLPDAISDQTKLPQLQVLKVFNGKIPSDTDYFSRDKLRSIEIPLGTYLKLISCAPQQTQIDLRHVNNLNQPCHLNSLNQLPQIKLNAITEIDVNKSTITGQYLSKLLCLANKITKINFADCSEIADFTPEQIPDDIVFENLQSIIGNNSNIRGDTLTKIIAKSAKLKKVEVQCCPLLNTFNLSKNIEELHLQREFSLSATNSNLSINEYLWLLSSRLKGDVLNLGMVDLWSDYESKDLNKLSLEHINKLWLTNHPRVGTLIAMLLAKLPNLQEIERCPGYASDNKKSLNGPTITEQDLPQELKLSKLKYLSFETIDITGRAILRFIKSSDQINLINISACKHCADLSAELLTDEIMLNLKNLSTFNYSNANIPVATVLKLGTTASSNTYFYSSSMDSTISKSNIMLKWNWPYKDYNLPYTIPDNVRFDNVKKIEIDYCTDGGIPFLAQLINACANVETIVLQNTRYNDITSTIKIRPHTSLQDLIITGSTISQHLLEDLIAAAPLLKKLQLNGNSYSSMAVKEDKFPEHISFNALESITCEGKPCISYTFLYGLIVNSLNLKNIKISNADFSKVDMSMMSTNQSIRDRVETIELDNSQLPHSFYIQLIQYAGTLKNIQINKCKLIVKSNDPPIAKYIATQFLYLTEINITDSDFDPIIINQIILQSKSLQKLTLHYEKVGARDIFAGISASSSFLTISEISLKNLSLSPDFLKFIHNAFPNLKILKLDNCIGLEFVKEKPAGSKGLSQLTTLVIRECNDIDEAAIKHLLLGAQQLTEVIISKCNNFNKCDFNQPDLVRLSYKIKKFSIYNNESHPFIYIGINTTHWLFKNHENLTALALEACRISENIKQSDIKSLAKLTSLDLSRTIIHHDLFLSLLIKTPILHSLNCNNIELIHIPKKCNYFVLPAIINLQCCYLHESNLPLALVLFLYKSASLRTLTFSGAEVSTNNNHYLIPDIKLPHVTHIKFDNSGVTIETWLMILSMASNVTELEWYKSSMNSALDFASLSKWFEKINLAQLKTFSIQQGGINNRFPGDLVIRLLLAARNVKTIQLSSVDFSRLSLCPPMFEFENLDKFSLTHPTECYFPGRLLLAITARSFKLQSIEFTNIDINFDELSNGQISLFYNAQLSQLATFQYVFEKNNEPRQFPGKLFIILLKVASNIAAFAFKNVEITNLTDADIPDDLKLDNLKKISLINTGLSKAVLEKLKRCASSQVTLITKEPSRSFWSYHDSYDNKADQELDTKYVVSSSHHNYGNSAYSTGYGYGNSNGGNYKSHNRSSGYSDEANNSSLPNRPHRGNSSAKQNSADNSTPSLMGFLGNLGSKLVGSNNINDDNAKIKHQPISADSHQKQAKHTHSNQNQNADKNSTQAGSRSHAPSNNKQTTQHLLSQSSVEQKDQLVYKIPQDGDKSTTETKLSAKELFYPPIYHPAQYRFEVVTNVDTSGAEIKIIHNQIYDGYLIEVKEIAFSAEPLRNQYKERFWQPGQSTQDYLLYDPVNEDIVITTQWTRLPSKFSGETLIAFYTDYKDLNYKPKNPDDPRDHSPVEIKYFTTENFYAIRAKKFKEGKLTPSKINFIIEIGSVIKKIQKVDYPNEIKALIKHCKDFHPGDLKLPDRATGEQILTARDEQQIGDCINRSIVMHRKTRKLFTQSQPFKDYRSRISINNIHAYIELKIMDFWYPVELGGYDAPLELTKIDTKGFDTPKQLPAKQLPVVSIEPVKKEITEADLWPEFVTWKTEPKKSPASAELLFTEIITPGRKTLLKFDNPSDCLLVVAEFAKQVKKPFIFINSADDLQWQAPGLKFNGKMNKNHHTLSIEDHFSLLSFFIATYPDGIIFINWMNFKHVDLVALHCILDNEGLDDGRMLEGKIFPSKPPIVGFYSDYIPRPYKGADFTTRHDAIYQWRYPLTADLYHNSREEISSYADNRLSIDLYESQDWESILLGTIHILDNHFSREFNSFLAALDNESLPLKALHLKNPPWQIKEFQLFWQHALQQRQFTLHGKIFKLHPEFKLSYSSGYELITDVIKQIPPHQIEFNYSLNPHTFQEFFDHYSYHNNRFIETVGLFKKHKKISLIVTHSVPLNQWCQLLAEAKTNNVELSISITRGITLPAEILNISHIKKNYVGQNKLFDDYESFVALDKKPISIIHSNSADAETEIAKELLQKYPDALYIDLDATHDFGDLFYQIHPSVSKEAINAKYKASNIFEALIAGKTIIVHGELPQPLINALAASLITDKAEFIFDGQTVSFKGKLILLTKSEVPFANNQYTCFIEKPKKIAKIFYPPEHKKNSPHIQETLPDADQPLADHKLSVETLPSKDDPNDLSIAAYENYKKRRLNSIMNGFATSNMIFYSGPTGIGKSTYFIKKIKTGSPSIEMSQFERDYFAFYNRKAKLYIGEDQLEAFANHNDKKENENVDAFLIDDEANLSIQKKSQTKGLRSLKPHLLKNGHYYQIKPNQRIIYIGNKNSEGGSRQQQEFFDQYTVNVACERPNHAYLYHEILKPQLAYPVTSVRGEKLASTQLDSKSNEKIAKVILAIFDKVNEIAGGTDPLLSPRHLHMMAVLFKKYLEQFSNYKITKEHIAIAACLGVMGDILPSAKQKALHDFLINNFKYKDEQFQRYQDDYIEQKLKQIGKQKKSRFTFSRSRYPVLKLIDDYLAMSEQENFHFGILLEGDSGVGKSSLFKNYLIYLGVSYKQFSFGKNYETDRKILLDAFHTGKKLIIDELNAGGPKYEKLINTLIMGTDEDGNKAQVPGFMIMSTQNFLGDDELTGRQGLPPAIRARYTPKNLKEQPAHELEEILINLDVEKSKARKCVSAYLTSLEYAIKHKKNPKPNLRNLKKASGVVEPEAKMSISVSPHTEVNRLSEQVERAAAASESTSSVVPAMRPDAALRSVTEEDNLETHSNTTEPKGDEIIQAHESAADSNKVSEANSGQITPAAADSDRNKSGVEIVTHSNSSDSNSVQSNPVAERPNPIELIRTILGNKNYWQLQSYGPRCEIPIGVELMLQKLSSPEATLIELKLIAKLRLENSGWTFFSNFGRTSQTKQFYKIISSYDINNNANFGEQLEQFKKLQHHELKMAALEPVQLPIHLLR